MNSQVIESLNKQRIGETWKIKIRLIYFFTENTKRTSCTLNPTSYIRHQT
jgi:hypothetical protein